MNRITALKLCVLACGLAACSSPMEPVGTPQDAQDASSEAPEASPCVPIADPSLCAAPSFVVDGLIYDRAYTCDATQRPAIVCALNKRTNVYCCRYGE